MTVELELPARTEPTESTAREIFPYSEDEASTSLPVVRARGVLHSSDGPDGRVGSTACPACDGETINGVGLFACTDCEWSGVLR